MISLEVYKLEIKKKTFFANPYVYKRMYIFDFLLLRLEKCIFCAPFDSMWASTLLLEAWNSPFRASLVKYWKLLTKVVTLRSTHCILDDHSNKRSGQVWKLVMSLDRRLLSIFWIAEEVYVWKGLRAMDQLTKDMRMAWKVFSFRYYGKVFHEQFHDQS